ncbi:MAG: DNA-directed RNA polymerase specialized sigma24 family protein, partial [Bradymonadia bacterium]
MEQRQLDRALVDACIAGSSPAWARLVEENREHVRFAIRRTAKRYGASANDDFIEDLESALFLRLVVDDFRRLRLYRGDASLRGWLKVLAVNCTVDALRKRRPTVPVGP